MGVAESVGCLADVVGGHGVVQGTFHLDHPLQVLSLDELHDDVVAVAFVVEAVCPDDVGMVQGGDRAGFREEAFQGGGVLADLFGDDFQGHAAVHGYVPCEEDAAHSAASQELDELIFTEEEGAPPGQQLGGLPAGNDLPVDERLGERLRIVAPVGCVHGLGELLRGEQAALAEEVEE